MTHNDNTTLIIKEIHRIYADTTLVGIKVTRKGNPHGSIYVEYKCDKDTFDIISEMLTISPDEMVAIIDAIQSWIRSMQGNDDGLNIGA